MEGKQEDRGKENRAKRRGRKRGESNWQNKKTFHGGKREVMKAIK